MGTMDKKITVVGQGNSVFNQFMRELRDSSIQGDRMRFRKNLFRCSQILAYELSKLLDYETKEITTPLGSLEMDLIEDQPVLVSILRAGVPMHNGFLDYFDHADNGFVSAGDQAHPGYLNEYFLALFGVFALLVISGYAFYSLITFTEVTRDDT